MARTKINPFFYRLGKTFDWDHAITLTNVQIQNTTTYHYWRKLYHIFFLKQFFYKKNFTYKRSYRLIRVRPLKWRMTFTYPTIFPKPNPFDKKFKKKEAARIKIVYDKKRKKRFLKKRRKAYPITIRLEHRRKFINLFLIYTLSICGIHVHRRDVDLMPTKYFTNHSMLEKIDSKYIKKNPLEFLFADWHIFIVKQRTLIARSLFHQQENTIFFIKNIFTNTLFSVYGSIHLRRYQFSLHRIRQPNWNDPGARGSKSYRWNAFTVPGIDKDNIFKMKTYDFLKKLRGKMHFFSYFKWLSLLNAALHWKSTTLFLKAVVYLFQRPRSGASFNIKFLRGILSRLFLFRIGVKTISITIRGSFGKITRTTSWTLQKTQKYYKRRQTDIFSTLGFAQKQVKRNRGILGISIWIFWHTNNSDV